MVIRELETCPRCGQADPWRKTSRGYTRIVNGERHIKCFCRRCGHPELVIYRPKGEKVPQRGTI